jgi:tubulin epsilon
MLIGLYLIYSYYPQALVDLVNKISLAVPSTKTGKRVYTTSSVSGVTPGSAITASDGGVTKATNEKPFDSMNNIVANMLLNMTR